MKNYICIEDGEQFIIEATDLDDARNTAALWGAEVIGEVEEVAQ